MTPDPEVRIAELEAENATLREQVGLLAARVEELQARLAKDSHNSGKPPSSDGVTRKTKSLRKRSGKRPGGQVGHRPPVCIRCQTSLDGASGALRERRQVWDLPPLRLVVREHLALHLRCPTCQAITVGAFPPEAPSRAQYGPRLRALAVYLVEAQFVPFERAQHLLADLFGVRLARGSVVGWVQQAAGAIEPVETAIKATLRRSPVLHRDETGVRRDGRLAWAHVASTGRLTHYAIHAKRGSAATDAIGILPGFTGVSLHDGWAGYHAYTTCRHALCIVHHLRELTFLEEEYHQAWAKDLEELLQEMRTTADQARAQGAQRLPATQRDLLLTRYRDLLAAGLAANPPPASRRRPGQRGRLAQSPARNLLERLALRQDEVLAFLDDLTIPFDNNQAERDLRGLTVHQKVSGCFRSDAGADTFACLRGYLATMRKQGQARLATLETVFTGQPLYPDML